MNIAMRKILLITFCFAASFIHISCLRDSYWIKLSGPVTIGSEWIEFRPKSPLKAEKDAQDIILEMEPPLKYDRMNEGNGPNAGRGILMPGGEVINPEIEIIDEYGNAFTLVWSGARGWAGGNGPKYRLPYPNELPRDRVYKVVRLRSPKPIKCKAIYWFCDSVKDWH
jgi:hypothetical protein